MAIPTEIRDKTAVCGVGMTKIGMHFNKSALALAVDAFKLALDDSGLKKDEVAPSVGVYQERGVGKKVFRSG